MLLAGDPLDKDDPYAAQSEVPADCGYQCKMVAGVVNIYNDAESLDRDEPLHSQYPQLDEFLSDHAALIRLISDGPLYVPLRVCLSFRMLTSLLLKYTVSQKTSTTFFLIISLHYKVV